MFGNGQGWWHVAFNHPLNLVLGKVKCQKKKKSLPESCIALVDILLQIFLLRKHLKLETGKLICGNSHLEC